MTKELVILSGKGGTGKTSLSAAFAHLAYQSEQINKIVLVDADVDASNLELVLRPEVKETNDFRSSAVAVIDPEKCRSCGICSDVCRYEAVKVVDGKYQIDPIACEGCKSCVYQCPVDAINMETQLDGYWFHSESRFGHLFHAHLLPAMENSGKLVTLVKQQGRLFAKDNDAKLLIVDGPPGIGCPVIAAASGASMVLVVVEPTMSGIHDMERALQTVNHFGIKAFVCINKADVNPDGVAEIEKYCQENKIDIVGKVRFDKKITEAMVMGEPVTAYDINADASHDLTAVWCNIQNKIID